MDHTVNDILEFSSSWPTPTGRRHDTCFLVCPKVSLQHSRNMKVQEAIADQHPAELDQGRRLQAAPAGFRICKEC